jgi:hypothetical protein
MENFERIIPNDLESYYGTFFNNATNAQLALYINANQ